MIIFFIKVVVVIVTSSDYVVALLNVTFVCAYVKIIKCYCMKIVLFI